MRFLIANLFLLLSLSISAQDNASEQSSVAEDNGLCNRLFKSTVKAYQELSQFLNSTSMLPINSSVTALMGLKNEDCSQSGTMARIERALSQHSGKIALLLPLSRLPKAEGQELIKQVQLWLQSRGTQSDRLLIWRDTGGSKEKLQTQLAQVVIQERVALIIGGLMLQETPVLAQWADRLRIPTILLNRKPEGQNSRYAFYMNPDTQQLASAMSHFALSRKLQRIAILEPQFSRDLGLIATFQAQSAQLGLQILGPSVYNPADYSSIDGILRKMFHIDDDSRKEELLELIKTRREQAKEEGVSFDPKKVMLPAIVDIDAMVIADHFKNVRHISKAISSYGVKHVQLIGIPRWRAYDIVDPPDENLIGAVFVDQIGSYKQMPYGIQVPLVNSEFFAQSAEAGPADLKLMLYHAIYTALQVVGGTRAPRFALYKNLETMKGPQQGFLNLPQVFRPNHVAYWPSFLFSIGSGSISLIQTLNPSIKVQTETATGVPITQP
ncbi:MAG: ABC transporter substrate-binding protein [Proteobacteria bacterium]|nr:ABC transporter substrate-binding protein [Pseudomonadota bacterium]